MRKRVVIGFLAIVAIGTLVFVVSQPKKGSVEWHKREYIAARKKLDGRTGINWARRVYCEVTKKPFFPKTPSFAELKRNSDRSSQAWHALHASGYLTVHQFTITNRAREAVAYEVWAIRDRELSADDRELTMFTYPETDTNMLVLVSPREEMSKWVEIIYKADAVGSRK